MSVLVFEVEAEYQKVTRMRKEIALLEQQLQKARDAGAAESVEEIASRLGSLRAELGRTVVAAASLGNEIGSSVRDKLSRAAEGLTDMGEAAREAVKAFTGGDFSTPQKTIDALSYAIYQNETAIAGDIRALQQYRDEAKAAYEAGNAEGLQAATQRIQEQIARIEELSGQTEQYRQALEGVLGDNGLGGGGADVPLLYSSEADIAQVELLQERIIDLKADIADVGASGGDTSALTGELQAAQRELSALRTGAAEAASALGEDLGGRAAEAQMRLHELNAAVEQQQSIVSDIEARVKEAAAAYDALRSSASASSDEIEGAAATYSQLSSSLEAANQKLIALRTSQETARDAWNSVSEEVSAHDSVMVRMMGGYDKYKEVLGMLPGPLKNVVAGINNVNKASWKFIASPIGAVIGAIVLALTALWQWFNKSAEGQRAFARVTGVVSGVLNKLRDILMAVGKAIYDAFTNPKAAVIALKDAIVNNIMNRLRGLGGMFTAFGKIMDNVFHGRFSEAKQSMKELGDQFVQSATGVENYADKLKKAADKVKGAVSDISAAGDISVARNDLGRERSAFAPRAEELRGQMTDAQMIAQDTSRSVEERKKALEEYRKLNKELTDAETSFAEREYELQRQQNKLSTNANEDYEAENRAKAALEAAKNEGKQRERALIRLQNSINRTGDSLASASEKAVEAETQAREQALEKGAAELLKLREHNDNAEIALMEEGSRKRLAEIEADYNKQLAAIEKGAAELAEANGKAGVGGTDEGGLTPEQRAEVDRGRQLLEESRKAREAEVYDEERQSMRSFLKDYGDYEQQKLALTEEYEEKIAKAGTIGEKMSLQRRRDEDLRELEIEAFDSTDWGAAFDSIENLSRDALVALKQRLVDAFNDGVVPAERLSDILARIAETEERIAQKQKAMPGAIGAVVSLYRRRKDLAEQEAEKQERINALTEQYKKQLEDIEDLRKKIQKTLDEGGLELDIDFSSMKLSDGGSIVDAMRGQGASDGQISSITDLLSQFSSMSQSAKGVNDALQGLSGASEGAAGAMGGMGGTIKMMDTIIHGINDNLQAMGDLMDELGMDGQGDFAKGMSSFMESSQYATQGWEDLKSGNVVGVASSVLGSLRTLGDAIGSWTGSKLFGSSDPHLEEDLERLAISNDDLKSSIDNLSSVMSDATTSLSGVMDAYDKQMADLEQQMANTQESMERSAAAYNNGFLGIGGSHSSNKHIDSNMSAADWRAVSEAAGVAVSSAADFWALTSEQMWNVQTYATSYYSKIKDLADDGYKDAAQYMDEYCDYYEQLIDLNNQYREELTSVSFDSVTDSFKSAISDMSHTAADFADDFESLMKDAMLNSILRQSYNTRLQSWYEDFAEALENDSTIDKGEQDKLRDSYMAIVNDARDEWESLYSALGWSKEGYSQSASSGGFTSMTEDTAEELNGRFTALQEAGYGILDEVRGGNASVLGFTDTLAGLVREQGGTLSGISDVARDMRDMVAGSYLELQQIQENTAGSLQQLQSVARYIRQVKENTDKL